MLTNFSHEEIGLKRGTVLGVAEETQEELVAGTEYSELAWYYENVKATIVSSPRGFLLIVAFPLKGVNHLFTLHRVFSFATRILNGTFITYQVEGAYFAHHFAAARPFLPFGDGAT
jgi:hypothetical protein